MDASAVLEWLRITAAYAAVGWLGLTVATGLWVSQHPDTAVVVIAATSGAIWWRYGAQIRRFTRVFLLWPPVRWYHKLVRKPIRYLAGGIMARWRYALVADKIDDLLMKLCYEDHLITKEQYRHLSKQIGQTCGLTDMVPRKRSPINIRLRVLENVAALKGTSVKAVENSYGWLLNRTKKGPVKTETLNFLKDRKSA